MATTLAICHNIFLTKPQRYILHGGGEVAVIGVSVPVWHHAGTTSEPAVEVFCRYILRNKPEGVFIQHNSELGGYDINLPPCRQKIFSDLPKNVWIPLSQKQQTVLLTDDAPCLDGLLDIKDGGMEWLAFRQFTKINKNGKTLNVVHFVEIKKLEDLIQTLA
jgi:hypothetical protein